MQKQVSVPVPAAETSRDSGFTRKMPQKPQASDVSQRLEEAQKLEEVQKQRPRGCGCGF